VFTFKTSFTICLVHNVLITILVSMKKTKVLIVEDEIIIADNICDSLVQEGYDVLEPCISYSEAVNSLETETPDIAILDIQLSGKKTGVDVAQFINEKIHIPFIFLTSNTDRLTLSQAEHVPPNSFLVKPFNSGELVAAIEITRLNFSKDRKNVIDDENLIIRDSIFIKTKRCYKRVAFNEIEFIQSDRVYLDIHLIDNSKITVRDTMSSLVTKLDDSFVRIHRSYIINTSYLKEIKPLHALVNDKELPLSKSYLDDLLSKLNTL